MSILGPCTACGKDIHALDGAGNSGNGWSHGDCERAASIDYGIAFDILYQRAIDMGEALGSFEADSAEDEDFQKKYDGHLIGASTRAADMTSWATYALARKGGVPDAV